MRRSRFFIAGIALIAACLTACGVATAACTKDVVVPTNPTAIRFVNPAGVTGLTTRTLYNDGSNTGHIHLSYPTFSGAPALNGALAREALRQAREFRVIADAPRSPADDAAANHGNPRVRRKAAGARPEINMEWRISAYSPQVIGVRLRTREFVKGAWHNSQRTLWYDRHARKATTSLGLISDKATFQRIVHDKLREQGAMPTLTDKMLGSIAFNADGGLITEFDDCEVIDCSRGRVAISIPREQVHPLLSGLGRLAQAAALAQRVPTPTPTPAATATQPQAAEPEASQPARRVALTFDDGPGPQTGRVLDELRAANAHATFFPVGLNATAQPRLLQRMVREGHAIGNHSWAHRDLSKLSSSRVMDSLGHAQDALIAATGVEPELVRPPYGEIDDEVREAAKRLGATLVGSSVRSEDWKESDPEVIAARVVDSVRPGSIVLLHDIHRPTVDALPAILRTLTARGYELVTVPELLGADGLRPGELVTAGPPDQDTEDGDV